MEGLVGWLGVHPWNRSASYIVFVGADPDIHLLERLRQRALPSSFTVAMPRS